MTNQLPGLEPRLVKNARTFGDIQPWWRCASKTDCPRTFGVAADTKGWWWVPGIRPRYYCPDHESEVKK
jgi:hypothetical protein